MREKIVTSYNLRTFSAEQLGMRKVFQKLLRCTAAVNGFKCGQKIREAIKRMRHLFEWDL